MIKRFFIYGILGWGMEVFWTGLGSLIVGDMGLGGFTNLWMFFIYGAAVFLEPIHDIMMRWKWPVRGLLWVVIIWGIEYTSGIILKSLLGLYPWLYQGSFAYQGIIRFDYAPAWFLAGFLFEKVHNKLDRYKVT